MKRLLLTGALIGATFACNAMKFEEDPEAKIRDLVEFSEENRLTVKQVNESLVNNEYVNSHQDEFLEFALKVQLDILAGIRPNYAAIHEFASDFVEASNKSGAEDTLDEFRPIAENFLARIRIIELAHEVCKGLEDHNLLDIKELSKSKAKLQNVFGLVDKNNAGFISSVSSTVFSKKGGITLVAFVAAFGISYYWNNSKKAQQSN